MNNNKIINFKNSNLNKIKFNKKFKNHKLDKSDNSSSSFKRDVITSLTSLS